MPLILTSPDTLACCSAGGCGRIHELGPAAIDPITSDAGELVALRFVCTCGAAMFAPRMSEAQAQATLVDPGVAWARRAWRRIRWAHERGLRLEPDYEGLAFADWPVPPGDHSWNLAGLWAALERVGWPDEEARERGRRHADVLARWPITSEGDAR